MLNFYNTYENENRQIKYSPVNNNDFETLQKARQDLVGEIQAVIEYDNHIKNTNNWLAKETWENIKHDELTHAGKLLALIYSLDPSQQKYVQQGINEFNNRLNNPNNTNES